MAMPEAFAQRILRVALDTNQAGPLLDCLFEGGMVTLTGAGSNERLVLAPAAMVDEMMQQVAGEPPVCGAGQ